jgi:hypothetical protein
VGKFFAHFSFNLERIGEGGRWGEGDEVQR